MVSIERKVFRDFYTELLKHPESLHKNKETILKNLNEIFKALGSLNTQAPENIFIEGIPIRLKEMTFSDLTILSKFANIFFEKCPLSEAEAEKILENMNAAEKSIYWKNSQGPVGSSVQREHAIQDLHHIKAQIYIHEDLEIRPVFDPYDFKTEAKNHVKQLFGQTQIKLQKAEEKLKQDEKKAVYIQAAAAGTIIVGTLLALSTPVVAAFVVLTLPIALAIFFSGALTAYAGFLPLWLYNFQFKDGYTEESRKEVDQLLNKLEKLETYKKAIDDPSFLEFINDKKHNYHARKNDHEQFEQLLELYQKEKKL